MDDWKMVLATAITAGLIAYGAVQIAMTLLGI